MVCVPTVLISLVSPAVGPTLRMLIGQKHMTFLKKIQLKNQSFLNPPFHYHTTQLPLMCLTTTMQARTLLMNHMYQERYMPFRLILFLILLQLLHTYVQLYNHVSDIRSSFGRNMYIFIYLWPLFKLIAYNRQPVTLINYLTIVGMFWYWIQKSWLKHTKQTLIHTV